MLVRAEDEVNVGGTVEEDLVQSREGSRTDDEVVQRMEEAMQLDRLNASQIRELREKSEEFAFLIWMKDKALKDKIEKAVVSQCLTVSVRSCGQPVRGSGNMETIMKAQAYQTGKDISTNYHASQKKTFEINPRHPVIRDMLFGQHIFCQTLKHTEIE
ncbi:Hypothetical predicted protein [Marmota monax]|uniref:Uncharacterized protein n=1 Tax=Marmota monax TaxID=9995 RepID=A0A5E4C632_MARMO|nr:hypothetical protein GHT09_008185 [Marmota monax]VTJ76431.1 Hypothetical predicted protein [Marmota monax]